MREEPSGMRRLALAALALALVLAYAAQMSRAAGADDDAPGLVRFELEPIEYSLGRAEAPLTLVEFTDYQCPYCRRFQAETFPRLKHDWIDTGKLRFVVRDLPLEIHSSARFAAEAAHCAGAQGKFWPMHDALLRKEQQLTEAAVLQLAGTLGVDSAQLKACVASARYEAAIAQNADQASALGLQGTPGFIVGRGKGREVSGVVLEGAQPYADFDALLKRLLLAR
jgi:protein-disulfide isomerase